MSKKFITVAAILTLAVSMMVGCKGGAEKVTAASLMEDVQKKTTDCKSMESKVTMNMTMEGEGMETMGGSMTVTADLDVDTVMDPMANHMTGNVGFMGINMDMEMYQVVEDDKLCTYTGTMGQWTVQKQDVDIESLKGFSQSSEDMLKNLDSLTLEDETRDVNGTEAYIISGTIEGDSIQSMLESASGSLGGLMGSTDSMDMSGMSVDVEYAVSKEDKTPLYTDMKFNGMDSVVKDSGVNISDFTMKMEYVSFDTVESISVPQEVIDKAQELDVTDVSESEDIGQEAESLAEEASEAAADVESLLESVTQDVSESSSESASESK